jgi:hypothetical protein
MTAKAKPTQVVKLPQAAGTEMSVHPGQMIQALMAQPDLPIEKLEKMFELQERFEANTARKAYHDAMATFGALVPAVTYDSWVNYKSKKTGEITDYGFASLAGTMIKLQEAMDQCGLKASWKTESGAEGYTKVTCFLTHALGHSEETSLSALPDPSGGKNAIQAVKSTVSYLKRITFEAIAGLATKEDCSDDGANATAQVECISPQQLRSITTKIAKVGAESKKLLELFNIVSLDLLPVDQYKPFHALLTAKEKADKAGAK